jgi:putative transposase
MTLRPVRYKRHRFPLDIIARVVWLYFRFPLSLRLVGKIPPRRGIVVSYESIGRWAIKLGADYACRPKCKVPTPYDIWHLDEITFSVNGEKSYFWRAIDQEGYVLDEVVQIQENTKVARRLVTRRSRKQGRAPKRIRPRKSTPLTPLGGGSCGRSNTAPVRGSTVRRRIVALPSKKRERIMQHSRSWSGLQRFASAVSAVRNRFVPASSRRCLSGRSHYLRVGSVWKSARSRCPIFYPLAMLRLSQVNVTSPSS